MFSLVYREVGHIFKSLISLSKSGMFYFIEAVDNFLYFEKLLALLLPKEIGYDFFPREWWLFRRFPLLTLIILCLKFINNRNYLINLAYLRIRNPNFFFHSLPQSFYYWKDTKTYLYSFHFCYFSIVSLKMLSLLMNYTMNIFRLSFILTLIFHLLFLTSFIKCVLTDDFQICTWKVILFFSLVLISKTFVHWLTFCLHQSDVYKTFQFLKSRYEITLY